ncbi:MAG: class I SAM-dependent methyltransferase [Legionellaceae bacterium]|nr:class I SAM-dependent methyltransferase [Legionellaceae bacterium]
MTEPHIAIGFSADDLLPKAQALALEYHFFLDNHVSPRLNVTADKLELLLDGFSPLSVDFRSITSQRRQDAGKQQGLVRACKPAPGMRILDVTAGWGRDAAILAGLGAEVLMLERQPVMAALLADGLLRLFGDAPSSSRNRGADEGLLQLQHVDAISYLQHLIEPDYPDVIYIDPMHPERHKSALVKKDMQALQRLFGPDMDAYDLIQLAIQRVKKRVVVKWPQRLPSLLKPQNSIVGKTVRFDLYHPRKSS